MDSAAAAPPSAPVPDAPPSAPVPDAPVVVELPPEHAETLGPLTLEQAFLEFRELQRALARLNPDLVRLEIAELRAAAAASDEKFVIAVVEQALEEVKNMVLDLPVFPGDAVGPPVFPGYAAEKHHRAG